MAREITVQIPSERIEQIQFGGVHLERLGVHEAQRAGDLGVPDAERGSGKPADQRQARRRGVEQRRVIHHVGDDQRIARPSDLPKNVHACAAPVTLPRSESAPNALTSSCSPTLT